MKYSREGEDQIDIPRLFIDSDAYTNEAAWEYEDLYTPI